MAKVLGRLEHTLSQQRGRIEGIMNKVFHSMMDTWLRGRKYNSSSSGQSNGSFEESDTKTGTQLYRQLSIADISLATRDFNNVYKGSVNFDGEALVVAIKMFTKLEAVGDGIHPKKLFLHPNLLSPIGFCTEGNELILVHKYMANGSLQDCLRYTDTPLSWEMRLQICIRAAKGLEYLRQNGELDLIHGCSEPSNILLDGNWVAKVKLPNLRTKASKLQGIVRSNLMHYYSFYKLDVQDSIYPHDDLYSFGVTLLEVLISNVQFDIFLRSREHFHRKPKYSDVPEKYVVKEILESEHILEVMHPHLIGKIGPECLREFVQIPLACLSLQGIQRPTIGKVVCSLQCAAQLQESWHLAEPYHSYPQGSEEPVVIKAEQELLPPTTTIALLSQGTPPPMDQPLSLGKTNPTYIILPCARNVYCSCMYEYL